MFNSENVRKHFENLSCSYSEIFGKEKSGTNFSFRSRLEIVRSYICGHTGYALDCASGTGEITSILITDNNFSKIHICDLSPTMLKHAKSNIIVLPTTASVDYKLINIFDLKPSAQIKYDVILCLGLIAHTGSLLALLKHLNSLLSESGKIVLQSSLLDHFGIKLSKILTSNFYAKKYGYEISYFSLADIKIAAEEAGLTITDHTRYCFGFPFADNASKIGNYLLEKIMYFFSKRYGSEAIFILSKK